MQAMFEPGPPLEFKTPVFKRKVPSISGIAALLKAKDSVFEEGPPPPKEQYETPRQRHARVAAAKKKARGRVAEARS